ncbi:MAG: hypothetical protein H0X15_06360 [Acidobacteria bacterium]|jgi:hypothetical protein|nr:hypothetical protein [Acidobacteriota bacterium]
MQNAIALLDYNNFYAWCERVFDASVKRKPIVVLLNNDGCVRPLGRSKGNRRNDGRIAFQS